MIETESVFMWPFAMTDEEATAWSALSDRVRKHLYAERVALEQRVGWMERVLRGAPRTYWMKWVEGPYYATGDMDELEFFRALASQEDK